MQRAKVAYFSPSHLAYDACHFKAGPLKQDFAEVRLLYSTELKLQNYSIHTNGEPIEFSFIE